MNAPVLAAGDHELVWDGKDTSGLPAPSGTYLYRVRAGDLDARGKVTLVR